jgi:hypothetical protein
MKLFGLRYLVPAIVGIALLSACSATGQLNGAMPDTPIAAHNAAGVPLPPTRAEIATLPRAHFAMSPMVSRISSPTLPASMRNAQSGISPNSSNPGDAEIVGTVVYGGGSYTGMYTENTAYSADQYPLAYPAGATGAQELFAPLSRPTNGGCFSPSTVALNTGTQVYSFFVVFDYCNGPPRAALAAQIDANFKQYYVAANANNLPVYKVLSITLDATPGPTSTWYLLLWNYVSQSWNIALTEAGQSSTTFGYSVWESLYQSGACSGVLPPSGTENMALWNGTTHAYESVTPTMLNTTSVVVIAGAQSCFNDDGTGTATDAFFVDAPNNTWLVETLDQRSVSCAPLAGVNGYYPCDLQNAYNLPSATNGSGKTVALVDAFDDPNAEADLATYRTEFGLPACTTANGCFTKLDEMGGTTYPVADDGWAQEISLDVDMVSATCPLCKIMLVEATSPSDDDLAAAEDTAVAQGASVVSNSFGSNGAEPDDTAFDSHYNHPGVPILASSGDSGYGVEFPAASQYVIAVGGTSLNPASTPRGAEEVAWSGAGSGCSLYEAKPAWQTDTGCTMRTVADVSAVADPNTGVATYDSYGSGGGWGIVGGTSVSSPIVAGAFAMGNPSAHNYAQELYLRRAAFFDVTSGGNGFCGAQLYLCNGVPGYDGPTGLGTPNGVTGFGALFDSSPRSVTSTRPLRDIRTALLHFHQHRVCSDVPPGYMRCNAIRLVR